MILYRVRRKIGRTVGEMNKSFSLAHVVKCYVFNLIFSSVTPPPPPPHRDPVGYVYEKTVTKRLHVFSLFYFVNFIVEILYLNIVV